MGKWNGPAGRGAMKMARQQKREEAEERQAKGRNEAILRELYTSREIEIEPYSEADIAYCKEVIQGSLEQTAKQLLNHIFGSYE